MKVFSVILLSVATVCQARPEAGYNYNAPNRQLINTAPASSATFAGNNFGYQGASSNVAVSSQGYNVGSTGPSSGGFVASANFGSGGGYNGAQQSYQGQSSFTNQVSSGFGSGQSFGGFSQGQSAGGFSGSVGGAGFGGGAQQTIVQKHIYVHVPPPEPEEVRQTQQISAGVAQKHYKIIFIKAPSPPTPSAQQIALAAQNQEKTIVYVLVKKPDEVGDINVQQIASPPPSKPEVYFIKYKTHREGGNAAGASVVSGGSAGVDFGNAGLVGSGSHISGSQISLGQSSSGSAVTVNTGSGNVPAPKYGVPAQSGPY